MGVLITCAVAGLIVGLFIGGFDKIWRFLKRLAAAAAQEAAAAKGGDDDDQGLDDDDDEADKLPDVLESALITEVEPGLDDHADLVLNPIVLYQMRRLKEEARRKKLLEMIEAQEAGEEVPMGKKKGQMKILSDLGALSWCGKQVAKGGDAARSQEIRDKMKQIDTHLQVVFEVDTTRASLPRKQMQAGAKKVQSASSLAEELKWHPLDADKAERDTQRAEYARRGRARVQPPLDQAIATAGVRRASCGVGGGRRASVSSKSKKGAESDDKPDEEE